MKSIQRLLDEIEYGNNDELRNRAGTELIGRSDVTPEHYTYVLEYCNNDELRNRALTELIGRSDVTPEHYTYVLRWCNNDELRNRAGTELIGRPDVTPERYTYVLRWCNNDELRNRAGKALQIHVGLINPPNEAELIKAVAERIISQPSDLKMDTWHCGTSHCIGGWACIISPIASQIEKKYNTKIAASAVLPSYAQWFYTDEDTALKRLESVLTQ